MKPTHYDRLGVAPGATDAQIHAAYRRLARQHHPDAGGTDVLEMTAVNDAWRTLSDPARRAMYDASLRTTARPYHEPSVGFTTIDHDLSPFIANAKPRRWPALALMIVAAMAALFVITAYLTASHVDQPTAVTSPRELGSGMCMTLRAGRAVEAACNGPHYGTIVSLIDRDGHTAPCRPRATTPTTVPTSSVCVESDVRHRGG